MRTLLPMACIMLLYATVGAASLSLRALYPKFFNDSPMPLLYLPAGTVYEISEGEATELIARRLVHYDETMTNENAAYFRPCEGTAPEKLFEVLLELRK